jgi:antitoxin ParD1/3/4
MLHWHNMPISFPWSKLMPTRNIVLTAQQNQLIEQLVGSGRYQNASEVLRQGLRMVERQEAEDALRLQTLRDAVQVGIADMEAGRFQSFESAQALTAHFEALAAEVLGA